MLCPWPSGLKSLNLVFVVFSFVSSPFAFFKSYDSSSFRSITFVNKKVCMTRLMMEELHTDSIDGGHEANYGLGHVPGRGRTPTINDMTNIPDPLIIY
jgi:hypothetical protein